MRFSFVITFLVLFVYLHANLSTPFFHRHFFNAILLSYRSGARNGAIHQHDVRVAQHNVATLVGHSQEVCGLAWSPSGTQLASGGNDNILNIWDVNVQSSGEINEPLHTIADHCAAVKVNTHAKMRKR